MTAVREAPTAARRPLLRRAVARWRTDAAVALGYLAAALILFHRVLPHPSARVLSDGGNDEYQWESFFSIVAHSVAGGHNPFFTALINHPDGVNLAANTTMPGLSIPLTPVTLVCGPAVTFLLVMVGGLAGTAFAWYVVFSRELVASRPAAVVGGACAAFGPPVISHAGAHPNFVVLFMLPLIVRQVVRLAGSDRRVRDGLVLGLLAAYQVLLGEEVLLFLATALLLYLAAWAVARPRAVLPALRRLVPGGAVAALVAGVLVGPVLWWQFSGPQSYVSLLHGETGQDLAALTAFATRSLAGNDATANALALGPTEQNGFLGWPLYGLLALIVCWLWRSTQVRVLAVVTVLLSALSLGSTIVVDHHHTGIPGPWWLLAHVPLYESVITCRIMLVCLPAVGALVALGHDRLLRQARGQAGARRWTAVAGLVAVAAALLPIVPTPLASADAPQIPELITSGRWHDYVRPGRTLVPVPVPGLTDPTAVRWQVAAGDGFALPEGYFLGPDGPGRRGVYGAYPRPTSQLLATVAATGDIPAVTDVQRRDAVDDLRYWQADALVLPDWAPFRPMLARTLTALLGPGRRVGDATVWRAPL